ncbi:MAG: pentapeptide repeat-containing protein [Hydrococcus sp. RM1_1_31]|nr:pentapeptide repeat-containing protein [Hydrococcus sp. RM1_1_31]
MSKSEPLIPKNRSLNWSGWNLSSIFHFLFRPRQPQHLIVEGEDAVEKLLSAYAQGVRDFSGSDLRRAQMSQICLPRIILRGALLNEADLWAVDFRNADLRNTNLTEANLIEADLRGANLSGCDFTDADLISADLRGANLKNACLRDTDLSGADLVDAKLTNADFNGAILDVVRWKANQPRVY